MTHNKPGARSYKPRSTGYFWEIKPCVVFCECCALRWQWTYTTHREQVYWCPTFGFFFKCGAPKQFNLAIVLHILGSRHDDGNSWRAKQQKKKLHIASKRNSTTLFQTAKCLGDDFLHFYASKVCIGVFLMISDLVTNSKYVISI